MVLYILHIKAEFENVASLQSPPTTWMMDVQEANGNEVRKAVVIDEEKTVDVAGGRSQAHFALTWPGAKKASVITVVRDVKIFTGKMSGAASGSFVPFIGFESRGLVPIKWYPGSDFIVEANGGSKFREVNLAEDWSEYDEERGQCVSVLDLESKFKIK